MPHYSSTINRSIADDICQYMRPTEIVDVRDYSLRSRDGAAGKSESDRNEIFVLSTVTDSNE